MISASWDIFSAKSRRSCRSKLSLLQLEPLLITTIMVHHSPSVLLLLLVNCRYDTC